MITIIVAAVGGALGGAAGLLGALLWIGRNESAVCGEETPSPIAGQAPVICGLEPGHEPPCASGSVQWWPPRSRA